MNLQKITAVNCPKNGGTRIFWVGSQAEASSMRKQLVSDEGYKRADLTTDAVNVPTDKEGLLEFLNANINAK